MADPLSVGRRGCRLWGAEDENLLPLLHGLPQPTFFSLDQDFWRPDWSHLGYGLVWLDVADEQAACARDSGRDAGYGRGDPRF